MEGIRTPETRHAPAVRPPSSACAALEEIERWRRLGVAVVHGGYGRKGPWPNDWPRLTHHDTWDAATRAATQGSCNLAVRLGESIDGRLLAHIDLDGKCPCGGDHADHDHGSGACRSQKCLAKGCGCAAYAGVPPDDGLAALLALLPADVAVIETGRGYRILFWNAGPIAESVLPEYGAEVAAHAGRLSIIPPSRHPSGREYAYVTAPGADLPVVDLEELGLVPQPKSMSATGRRASAASQTTAAPAAVDPVEAAAFAKLMSAVNVVEGQGARHDARGEFFLCPWHADGEASLHVLWESAVFWCLGCERGGGLVDLRELVECSVSPRTFPDGEADVSFGDRGTFRGEELVEHVASLVDALLTGTFNVDGQQLRECRQHVLTYQCAEGHAFAPRGRRGSPTPLSCDASGAICPRCGPARFLVDARAADGGLPERVHAFRLIARTPGRELLDLGLSRRLTARLKAYRKSHGLTAGSPARSFHLTQDGAAFSGHFILAVPPALASEVTPDGAFDVDDLGEHALEEWHRLQVAEQLDALRLLTSPQRLEAFYRTNHGQQRFRHFGSWYGNRVDAETSEVPSSTSADGSGSRRPLLAEPVLCPLHPGARVWRASTPALRSTLARDGEALVPRARDPVWRVGDTAVVR